MKRTILIIFLGLYAANLAFTYDFKDDTKAEEFKNKIQKSIDKDERMAGNY